MKIRRFQAVAIVIFLLALVVIGIAMNRNRVTASGLETVGQYGGANYTVAVAFPYVYLGSGTRVLVVDVTDPAQPRLAGKTAMLGGIVQTIAIHNDLAYVAAGAGGLSVLDITEPEQPRLVQTFATDHYALDVAVQGNTVFVANGPVWNGEQWGKSSVQILDATKSSDLQLITTYEMPEWLHGLATEGDWVYLAAGDSGILILDVKDPQKPREVSRRSVPGYALDIAKGDDTLYVADLAAGLQILDIADPTQPRDIRYQNDIQGKVQMLELAGDYMYAASDESGLYILNLNDPHQPDVQAVQTEVGSVQDIVIAQDVAYVANHGRGLQILDMSDKSEPTLIGSYDILGYVDALVVAKEESGRNVAFVANGDKVVVLDTSSPNDLDPIASFSTPGDIIDVAIDRATIIKGGETFTLAVAEVPEWKGDHWSKGGVRLFTVDDKYQSDELSFLQMDGEIKGIDIEEDTAYIAAGSKGLRLVDISVPDKPIEIGYYQTRNSVYDVVVAEQGCVYIATENSIIHLCKGQQPATDPGPITGPTPAPGDEYRVEGVVPRSRWWVTTLSLASDGNNLYFTDLPIEDSLLGNNRAVNNRVYKSSLEEITNEHLHGNFYSMGAIRDISIVDEHIYMANGDGGVTTLREIDSGNK